MITSNEVASIGNRPSYKAPISFFKSFFLAKTIIMTKPIISYLLVNIFINYMLRKTTHPPRTMVKDVPNILISQKKTLFFTCHVYIYMPYISCGP